MLRVCHSLWSRPALKGRWNVEGQLSKDLWPFALSAHWVKQHGHTLVLHTDELGEQIFGVLPYDEICRTLDDLPVADAFWAAGKVWALTNESLGTVHLDGDVFIKSPEIFERIENSRCDLIVQSDYWSQYTAVIQAELRPYLVRFLPQVFESDATYNCGVLSFRSETLKNEYIAAYQKATSYLSRSNALTAKVDYDRSGTLALDLVIEQRLLRVLAEGGGATVEKLLPPLDGAAHVDQDGFEHPMWITKYRDLSQIQDALRRENPDLAAAVEAMTTQLIGRVPMPSKVRTGQPGSGAGERKVVRIPDPGKRYAIVTPYYKEPRDWLERCIDSVKAQTFPTDHFVVADGHPQDWVDGTGVRHIKLDRGHEDCGNTPRGIGAMLAICEEYDAIGMLDADNWLEPDHVEACLVAASTTPTECDYVLARRFFHRFDGSEMEGIKEEAFHVDTSCFFFLRGSFGVVPYWGIQPRQMSGECDRVFYFVIRQWDFVVARVARPTVHFTSQYRDHYRKLGETPPAEAKHTDLGEAMGWLTSLPPREHEVASRIAGFFSQASPAQPRPSVPRVSMALPV